MKHNDVTQWVDSRVDAILKYPRMWGERQSQELQLLQLMEVRKLVTDGALLIANPRLIVEKWIEFHQKKFGNSNQALSKVECTDEEHTQLLRELVDDLKNA